MADEAMIPDAVAGDALTPEDLQAAHDWLMAQADALSPLYAAAPDLESAQAIGRQRSALRTMATKINARQIDLLVDEARVSAEHIRSAIDYAAAVVASIKDTRLRIRRLGQVLDFFAAVLSGSGSKIVKAAQTLKKQLDDKD